MMNLKAARFGAWIDRKHSVAEFLLPEDSQRNLADKLLKISNLLKTREVTPSESRAQRQGRVRRELG